MNVERMAPVRHDTLDDVPEPAENPNLFGHAAEAARLAGAYRTGKLHHALILSGPQGIGKATFAFHLARHLLAHPEAADAPADFARSDPQGALFRMVAQGAHPAVLHLTRPMNEKTRSFRSAVTVEEIRKVQRFLGLTSHDGAWRIVIVDPADDMNANAANALLKNLEEPPSRTLFVLISHAAGGLLPTIRSRCLGLRLHPLADDDFGRALGAIGLAADEGSRQALHERAAGSVREAILLTQYGGLEIADTVERLAAGARFDVALAGKLADAVAGRDQDIAFSLFNRAVFDLLEGGAAGAARQGDLQRAERIAAARQEAARSITETETYNLDKRQHVLGLMRRVQAAMAG